ncbi:MAG: metallophosphoesterase [Muribaculaceae bacterium]|nr:metallophosphoesterase [Muribaculaceae bacterium]
MRIPVIAAIALWVMTLACDIYIYFQVKAIKKSKIRRRSLWVYGLTTALCWALLIVILCMPRRDASQSILPIMWMLFTFLSIYLGKACYCIFSLLGKPFRALSRKKRNFGAWIGAILGIIVFATFWIGAFYTRRDIEVNRVALSSDKLPQSFNGLKVVQFSDAHVGTWGSDTTFLSKMVDTINAQKPDIVLFTGDFVNRRSNELDPYTGVLGKIQARIGVYAVHGNHDYGSYTDWPNPGDANRDVARLDSLITSMGWKILNNRVEFVSQANDSIAILGVENWGEPPFNQLGRLDKVYPASHQGKYHLNDNMFKILLTHNPEHWRQVVRQTSNIDLTLSGHTHAMQFMLKAGNHKWSPCEYKYEEWAGEYDSTSADGKPMKLYVNIGCGEVGFPARIGAAKPEITLFTLASGK